MNEHLHPLFAQILNGAAQLHRVGQPALGVPAQVTPVRTEPHPARLEPAQATAHVKPRAC